MWKSSTHCDGVVFCRSWRAFTREFVAVGAGRGHVGVLAPSRFCLRVAGVVAIFVGEGRLAWVFLSCFCSRIRVRARACLFVLCYGEREVF